jgi:hypothetical protein
MNPVVMKSILQLFSWGFYPFLSSEDGPFSLSSPVAPCNVGSNRQGQGKEKEFSEIC